MRVSYLTLSMCLVFFLGCELTKEKSEKKEGEGTPVAVEEEIQGTSLDEIESLLEGKAAKEPEISEEELALVIDKVKWPFAVNKPIPEFALLDVRGKVVNIRKLAGKPVLIEYVSFESKASQSLAGSKRYGGFYNPNDGLGGAASFRTYFGRYTGGLSLKHPSFFYLQIVLAGEGKKPPKISEMRAWAKHFEYTSFRNMFILQGTETLLETIGTAVVPGFQLLDAEQKLLGGWFPGDNANDLYTALVPAVAELVKSTN